ncbi:MAG: helix-turn-helix transcriptional regulator [Gemmatimonadota bacterium]
MDTKKRAKLESAGWRVGEAEDFLKLTAEEVAFVELKLALSSGLKDLRSEHGLTQGELAEKLGSSQSRVAKMEASDPSVSVDLLVRAMLAVGATKKDIAEVITRRIPKRTRSRSARGNTG